MIGFMVAQHFLLWIWTKQRRFYTAQNRASVARNIAMTLKTLHKREVACGQHISEAELKRIMGGFRRVSRV